MMKIAARYAGVGTALLIVLLVFLLAGCGLFNGPNVPSFLSGDHLTQIKVINDQTGQQGLASNGRDNMNELLNLLHLGDITADSRQNAPEPASSVYTLIAYNSAQMVWTIRVLDAPQSSRIYLQDAVHPANSGFYPLKQAISISDLDQFVHKYPAS